MNDQKLFQENPALYTLIPMLYMVWADAILTPTEIEQISKLIESQTWMTKAERENIHQYINPKKPPAPNVLKQWQKIIVATKEQADYQNQPSLVDISVHLAIAYGLPANSAIIAEIKPALEKIVVELGVISHEASYHLRFSHHTSNTGEQNTTNEFDIATMTSILDGDDSAMIDKVKTVLSDPAFAYKEYESVSEYREQVLHWCQLLAKQGFGAMAFPVESGGEADIKKYFTIMETLSYHDLSMVIKFGVQFGLFGMSILFLGTEKHHKKHLKSVGTLDLPGCFAMTETGHGSNVKGLETTATYNHANGTFTVHTPHVGAGKEYIGNAAVHGRMATVFAKLVIDGTDYGVNAFLVPLRDETNQVLPGVTIKDCGHKMGLNGVDNGMIWFDSVVIPKDNMLDKFASVDVNGQFQSPITSDNRRFFTMLGTLVGGRIGIPRSGLSATKVGLTIAIRYADGRKQFGPENGSEVSILNYRTHQRRLLPLLATTYACHFALRHLTNRFLNRTEEQMQEIEALAAGMKAFTTWHTTSALQECREACGGKGYLSENRIDRLKNDTEVYTTFEGDNTVLMQLVAKGRLSEFKKDFMDINLFGMLSYVAGQAKTSITEKNPITVRNTDEDHLLDPEFHLAAFRFREKEILTSAAQRLKKHFDKGMDSFDAFNQTQYHMVQVGHAYVERVILEQFQLHVAEIQDAGCKAILTKLCSLFALHRMEVNKGWYLEQDYMEGVKTKAIRRLINKLCWEVRKEAVPLVDAFAIPESCIGAPIAMKG
jgi:acyl-CoA oxidase